MPDPDKQSPGALAHGAAKRTDIERVRETIEDDELRVAAEQKDAAVRRLEDLQAREAKRKDASKP